MVDKILIIDDEPHVLSSLVNLVVSGGYKVLSAVNGADAIETAAPEKPVVILVDLLLGDMPGFAVMTRIREILPTAEFIIVTGMTTKASAVAAVNLGAFGYIEKPWDGHQLMAMIRSAIKKHETSAALIESEHRYRLMVESMQGFIFMIGHDMCLSYVNKAWSGLFQKDADDLLGVSIRELFPVDVHTKQIGNLSHVLRTGESIVVEDSYPFPAGNVCLNVSLSPVRNEAGDIISVHGICREIN